MIRIDEIYYNVFVQAVRSKPDIICHWFDPFGSTNFQDLCVHPSTTWPDSIETRLIFWDQEPLWKDRAMDFMDQFEKRYHHESARRIIITSEKNSTDLKWFCDTYNADSAYYFFHGWAALDWYRGYNHSFLSTQPEKRILKYPLFIPNNIIGGRRNHRIQLLSALSSRDSVQQNLISFPEVCPYEKIPASQLAQNIGIDLSGIKLPLVIDQDCNHAGSSHKIDFWEQAQDCFCHVVTETIWGDRLHLTEKTFKPIVMQQPFILVGSRNSLAYLRNYGFQTFSTIWDESYDSLPDSQRMEAIADLCATISHWSSSQLHDAHEQARSIVQHNFNWFYGEFQNLLWHELTEMIDTWR